jgi:hypothetical protein
MYSPCSTCESDLSAKYLSASSALALQRPRSLEPRRFRIVDVQFQITSAPRNHSHVLASVYSITRSEYPPTSPLSCAYHLRGARSGRSGWRPRLDQGAVGSVLQDPRTAGAPDLAPVPANGRRQPTREAGSWALVPTFTRTTRTKPGAARAILGPYARRAW